MKTIIPITILTLLTLNLPQVAFASAPTKYPNCSKEISVKSVPNGSGVYFDETCSVAYVLPPTEGKFEINSLVPNSNTMICGAYEGSFRMLNNLYAHLELITKQLSTNLDNSSNDLNINGDTSIDGTSSNTKSVTVAAIKPMDPILQQEFNSTLDLIQKTKLSMALFEDDKKGVAVGTINYLINWNDLVESYRKANPKIQFERLPLEAGRIVFARKLGAQGEVMNGAVSQDFQGFENVSGVLADGTLHAGSGAVLMSDSMTGQIVLNFAGACPFVKNNQMPKDITAAEMNAYLGANFQYRYSLQGLRTYRASYNLASIAKHIQEAHTSGGFFSTHTDNSVIDSNSSSDEFNMTIDSNQASFEYDATLRSEVKTELVARVMREMALATGESIVVPGLTAPPANGAETSAAALEKCPNMYCQMGAMGLKVLNSIFGNSNAVASYIREKNGVSVDNVTEKRMFSYTGSTIFSGTKK